MDFEAESILFRHFWPASMGACAIREAVLAADLTST